VIVTKEIDGMPVSECEQPAIVAVMLEQLGLEPGQRVLEIGAGTGQTAALMAHIVGESGQVITLDIEPDLVSSAREHLAAAGLARVQVVCADGAYGLPEAAPFDRIILTVGSPDITTAWREQLRPVYFRSFGPDDALAHKYIGLIKAWDAAGRPDCERLRIRAIPLDYDYAPGPNKHVLNRPSIRLVLTWEA
jgi:SAM-dependent methyltransferase